MKKTWEGINDVLLHRRKKTKIITAIKDPNKRNKIVKESSQVANILKVARYSFSGSIAPKFERKLRRHKQRFGELY